MRFGEADKSEETITLLWREFPRDISTAHHGAGKLSIPSVSAWFENGQYFVVAWRRRPLLCVPAENSTETITVWDCVKRIYTETLRRHCRLCFFQIKSLLIFFIAVLAGFYLFVGVLLFLFQSLNCQRRQRDLNCFSFVEVEFVHEYFHPRWYFLLLVNDSSTRKFSWERENTCAQIPMPGD